MQEMWVQSLVRELRSHMLWSTNKEKKKKSNIVSNREEGKRLLHYSSDPNGLGAVILGI